jgi:hypothetical protein
VLHYVFNTIDEACDFVVSVVRAISMFHDYIGIRHILLIRSLIHYAYLYITHSLTIEYLKEVAGCNTCLFGIM